jgi:hypothetical protein
MLSETEINNTFDLNVVEETLTKTLENSYWYLYNLQRNVCKYKQYYIKDSKKDAWNVRNNIEAFEYYVDEKGRVCMYIDADLVYEHARGVYHSSDYYKKEFTIFELNEHRDIFERIPLINIDFVYHLDIKVRLDNGQTIIILNRKKDFLFNKDELIHHVTNIELITNEKIRVGEFNKETVTTQNNRLSIPVEPFGNELFEKYGTYKLILSPPDDYSGNLQFLDKWGFCDTSYRDYINGDITSDQLESITITNLVIDNNEISGVLDRFIKTIPGNFKIYAFYYKNLARYLNQSDKGYKSRIIKSENKNVAEVMTVIKNLNTTIPYNMPIPVENTITYAVNDTFAGEENISIRHIVPLPESSVNLSDTSCIKLIYPFFYIINHEYMKNYNSLKHTSLNDNDNVNYYTMYYFYIDTKSENKYKNLAFFELSYLDVLCNCNLHNSFNKLYYKIIDNTETQYYRDNFNDIRSELVGYLGNIAYYVHTYDVIDYINRKQEEGLYSYKYKVETLLSFIRSDGFVLRDYAVKQNDLTETYTLDLFKLKSFGLERKLRTGTSTDIHGINDTFDNPMYLFKIQLNNIDNAVINIWVYGIRQWKHKIYKVEDMFYIYIPKESIDYIYKHPDDIHKDIRAEVDNHRYMEIEVSHSLYYETPIYFGNSEGNKQVSDIIIDENKYSIPSLNDIHVQPTNHKVIKKDEIYNAIYTDSNTEDSNLNKKDFEVSIVSKLRDYDNTLVFATNNGNNTSYDNKEIYPRSLKKWNDSIYELDKINQYNIFKHRPDNNILEYQFNPPTNVKYNPTAIGLHNQHSKVNHIRLYSEKEELTGGDFGDYKLFIDKRASSYTVKIDRYRFPIICICDLTNKLIFKEDYLRIWYNGRLIHRNMYKVLDYNTLDIEFDEYYEEIHFPRIQILFETKIGDEITVEIYPYKLTEINTIEKLTDGGDETHYSGIIEFNDSECDKPVDIDYYDFYINGRKLTKREISLYKPRKSVFMNLQSANGELRVFKKERDYEYFGWNRYPIPTHLTDFTDTPLFINSINDPSLHDRIYSSVISRTISYLNWYYYGYPIRDSYSNMWNINNHNKFEEMIDKTKIPYNDYYKEKIFYYEELITIRLINPNIFQINNHYLKTLYRPIYDTYIQKFSIYKYGQGLPNFGRIIDDTDDSRFRYLSNELSYTEFIDNDTGNCVYEPIRIDNINVVHLNPNRHMYEYDENWNITNFQYTTLRGYEYNSNIANKMDGIEVYMLGNYEDIL